MISLGTIAGARQLSVDGLGLLTWQFAAQDVGPFALYYDTNGDANWLPLATGKSGTMYLTVFVPSNRYTIVMISGGQEVERYTYNIPAGAILGDIRLPDERQQNYGFPLLERLPDDSDDPTEEIVSNIPNWLLLAGAGLGGWLWFSKEK